MILLSPPRAQIIPHPAPATFPALMDLYECNYINMRRLLPVMPKVPTHLVSRIPDGLDLHLRLIERFRYTSEWHLTYQFIQDEVSVAEPDLRIRVYHDARLAEVTTAHLRHYPAFDTECPCNPLIARTQINARWKINRFLFKWLNYCLRQGHRFGEASVQKVSHPLQ